MDSTLTFDQWLSYYVCLRQDTRHEVNLLLPGSPHHESPITWVCQQYRQPQGLLTYWRMNDDALVPVCQSDMHDVTFHELSEDTIYQGVVLYPSILETIESCQEPLDMVVSLSQNVSQQDSAS